MTRTLLLPGLLVRLGALACVVMTAASCTLDKQGEPRLTGPSEFGLSIALTAFPTVLDRDGASIATLRVTARDDKGRGKAGVQLRAAASSGLVSAVDITTGADGTAQFDFIAPPRNSPATSATVSVSPVELPIGEFPPTRTVTIKLVGPDIPVALFTFAPPAPAALDVVTFDASTTTLSGQPCGSVCTYAWNFGDGSTSSGLLTTHRFGSQGTFIVVLSVTAPGDVTSTASRTVVVGAAASVTARISVSPTNPLTTDTVFFDGRSSTSPDGSPIVSYDWDFGNGTVASGPAVVAPPYLVPRTYTVRLTVTDSRGRTGTTTIPLPVTAPVTP